jgi:hypothetical protein
VTSWTTTARQVPVLRRQLARDLATSDCLIATARALEAGKGAVVPRTTAMDAAAILNHQEATRLREATLYYATDRMTALACAAASTPPLQPITRDMAPADTGLLVFGQTLDSYDSADVAGLTVEICAVSWGPWTARTPGPTGTPPEAWFVTGHAGADTDEGGYTYEDGVWLVRTADWPADKTGTWVSFWSRSNANRLAPPRPGYPVPTAPLVWDNESLLFDGGRLGGYQPHLDDHGGWLTVLYTCWQMMRQAARTPLVHLHTELARPVDARRTHRQGYTHAHVHVIDLHRTLTTMTTHIPTTKTREYHCRWPVRPHRRMQCMNPRAHAEGGCTHAETLIPFHIRGPKDKPLAKSDTVHVWSHTP